MLIKDHIKLHGDSPLRGLNIDAFGPRFNDMSDPYPGKIRDLAKASARNLGIPLKEGIYYYMAGPSYETKAEVRAIGILGANVVGMSTVPEVIIAAHAGMTVMGLSCITNMGTGLTHPASGSRTDQPLSHDEVVETGKRVKQPFISLMKGVILEWASR